MVYLYTTNRFNLMKIFYLVLFFTLFIATTWAQKVVAPNLNVDSLVRIALADTTKISPVANKDSLFRLLPSTKSTAKRIKLVYQMINSGTDVSMQGLSYHYKVLNWAKAHN